MKIKEYNLFKTVKKTAKENNLVIAENNIATTKTLFDFSELDNIDALSFTESEAKDITDLFYKLKLENPINHWRVLLSLNDVSDYIREWENHWHRENNLKECFEYERDNNFYDYTEEILSSIDSFKECVMDQETQFVYQLPNNEMVVVVC